MFWNCDHTLFRNWSLNVKLFGGLMWSLPLLLQEMRRWEMLISGIKVGFGSLQTRLSNWNEDPREKKRKERRAAPIFPGNENQSGLGEINPDQTWKRGCLPLMVIHLGGSRKPCIGIVEILSSLWVLRIRLVSYWMRQFVIGVLFI